MGLLLGLYSKFNKDPYDKGAAWRVDTFNMQTDDRDETNQNQIHIRVLYIYERRIITYNNKFAMKEYTM